MITNKYIVLALSVVSALIGWGMTYKWSSFGTSTGTAATILAVLSTLKVVINAIAPAPGAVVNPTGGTIITHS